MCSNHLRTLYINVLTHDITSCFTICYICCSAPCHSLESHCVWYRPHVSQAFASSLVQAIWKQKHWNTFFVSQRQPRRVILLQRLPADSRWAGSSRRSWDRVPGPWSDAQGLRCYPSSRVPWASTNPSQVAPGKMKLYRTNVDKIGANVYECLQ